MNQAYAQIIMKLIDATGGFLASLITRPNYDEIFKIYENHYNRLKEISERRKGKKLVVEQKQEEETKQERGTACLTCSRDHLSTVSAALNEAIRFARKEGIDHKEVVRRIGIALDELNIMERIDLAADEIIKLPQAEREIANWVLKEARELRHDIAEIQSLEDLEKVAAKAATLRTKYLEKLWELTKKSGPEEIIERVCGNLSGEEREKCEQSIREFLKEDHKKVKEVLQKIE